MFKNRKDSNMSHDEVLICGAAIAILTVIGGVGNDHFLHTCNQNGMKVRVAVCNLIYKKSLRLSQTALLDTAPGKMVNLLANDVNRFDVVSMFVNAMWSSPLITLIAAILLWREVQWAGLIGMVIVFIIVPVQSKFCVKLSKCETFVYVYVRRLHWKMGVKIAASDCTACR